MNCCCTNSDKFSEQIQSFVYLNVICQSDQLIHEPADCSSIETKILGCSKGQYYYNTALFPTHSFPSINIHIYIYWQYVRVYPFPSAGYVTDKWQTDKWVCLTRLRTVQLQAVFSYLGPLSLYSIFTYTALTAAMVC